MESSMKIIETERLVLRPITEGDAQDIFEYCQNPNVGIHAGWKPHDSIEETREIMKTIFLGQESVFGMTLKETGKLFGTIGLMPDPKRQNDKAMMLGYAISEDYWGNGYATEANPCGYGFWVLRIGTRCDFRLLLPVQSTVEAGN